MSLSKYIVQLICLSSIIFYTSYSKADHVDCNNSQKLALESATYKAHTWLSKALSDIDTPQPNPTYSKWFGSWTVNNGAKVKQNLGNLKAHMTIANITYHCKCPPALD